MTKDREKVFDSQGRIIKAGGLVFDNTKNKILLVSPDGKQWSFPKGHLEKDESIESCALREVFEETGIRGEIKNRLPVIEYKYEETGQQILLNVFLIGANSNKVSTKENHRVKWFDFNEAVDIISYQSLKDFLIKVRAEIE